MKAAEPVPRTQPYSKPRRPLPGGGEAAPSAKASAKIGDRRQRRGVQQADPKQKPKSMRREIAQGHRGGQRDADHEHDTERLGQVADAAGERRREQSHGRAGAEHEPELLGRQAHAR